MVLQGRNLVDKKPTHCLRFRRERLTLALQLILWMARNSSQPSRFQRWKSQLHFAVKQKADFHSWCPEWRKA